MSERPHHGHDDVLEKADKAADRTVNSLFGKAAQWVMPGVVGLLLVNLLDARAREVRLAKVEQTVEQIQTSLANGGPPLLAKRVDGLETRVSTDLAALSKKMDDMTALLLTITRR